MDNNIQNTSTEEVKKTNKKKVIIGLILLLIVVAGVVIIMNNNLSDKGKTDTKSNKVHSVYRMSGNSLEEFDLSFLKLGEKEKNVIYSPLSIKYALAMLNDGTDGNSNAQITALIGDYKSNKYTNSSNLSLANAMFINNTFEKNIKESYIDNLKNKYSAEVVYDSFKTPNTINSWVNKKTLGLIDELVDDVSDKHFVLVNALAIDMEWNKLIQANSSTNKEYNNYSVNYAHEKYNANVRDLASTDYGTVKFNNNSSNVKAVEIGASINNYDIVTTLGENNIRETITKEYTKWLNEGEGSCGNPAEEPDVTTYVNQYIKDLDSNYKMVESSTDFKFYNDENVKVFTKELKEYNNTTLEYIGIMPKNKTLNEYIKGTTAKNLSETINKTKTIELDNFKKGFVYKITGGIPLFKYDYELNLMEDLKKLGVEDIFQSEKANLSKMVKDTSAVIDSASHKANIEFSNEGIKAAAATEMGGMGSANCGFEYLYDVPVVEINLTFNNPYLYIIRDKKTGEVWFVGTVYEPIANTNNYGNFIE